MGERMRRQYYYIFEKFLCLVLNKLNWKERDSATGEECEGDGGCTV